jgi:hypothetical protein
VLGDQFAGGGLVVDRQRNDPDAQTAELFGVALEGSFKPKVVGSSPTGGTTKPLRSAIF